MIVDSINLGNEIRNCYRIYGVSVAVSRAIPDVFDGLNPVKKRIIYTMHTCNYRHAFAKSIAVCADVQK